MTIEDYLEKTYWVIDPLPRQVPAHSRGQYFRIEEHFRSRPLIDAMVRQSLSDLRMLYVMLPAAETLITLSADDIYMTIYNPTEETLKLLASLVASEGLFIWRPEQ